MLGNEDRMKISTKGRYAVRVMLDLALNNNGECIKVKEIAARQGISEKYLEQIIAVLNKAGYVKSVRGAQGGYRIAKDPADFTVGMILRLTEGSLPRWHVWRKALISANDVIPVRLWRYGRNCMMQ